MSGIQKLEENLRNQTTKKSLLEILTNYLSIWLKEFEKTVLKLLSTPTKGKNQITKELDEWENSLNN